jgi:hypothetical protein
VRLLQTTARRPDRRSARDVVLDGATRGVGVATAAYTITTLVRPQVLSDPTALGSSTGVAVLVRTVGVAALWSAVNVALLLARR